MQMVNTIIYYHNDIDCNITNTINNITAIELNVILVMIK